MKIYVIYDHPMDYPEYYVVRIWNIIAGNPDPVPENDIFIKSNNLESIREKLGVEMGLFCIPRDKKDCPQIIETWI